MPRTNTVKNISDEGYGYMMMQPDGESGLYARLQKTASSYASDTGEFSEADTYSSGEAYVVCMNSIHAAVTIAVGQDSGGDDVDVSFAAGDPIAEAKITSGLVSIPEGYPKITSPSGTTKDLFEILKVYTPTDYIGFVTATSGSPVETFRAVKDKGELKGRKRNVETAGQLSLSQYYQNAETGLVYQAGKRVIIQIDIREDSLLETNESLIYYGAFAHRPETNETTGENLAELQYDFEYERKFYIEQ